MSLVELAVELAAVDVAVAGEEACGRVLEIVSRIRAGVDGFEALAMARLRELAARGECVVPEMVAARSGQRSSREQQVLERRAATVESLPELGSALVAGELTGAHVDAVGAAVRRLEPGQRDALISHGEDLVGAASRMGADEFDRWLGREVRAIEAAAGVDRLSRQRRANRFRTWHQRDTGMLHGSFQLDPESGLAVLGALRSTVEALFHDAAPETCPSEPLERQDHLRALAFVELITGARRSGDAGTRGDGPDRRRGNGRLSEMIVVVAERTLLDGEHPGSRMSTGTNLDLGQHTLRRWLCTEVFIPALIDEHGVMQNMGRGRRLATADQRRQLAVMYDRCAIPDCQVPFRQCQPHHLDRWIADHGSTDLANLIPLCSRHHHAVHEGGWGSNSEHTVNSPSASRTAACGRRRSVVLSRRRNRPGIGVRHEAAGPGTKIGTRRGATLACVPTHGEGLQRGENLHGGNAHSGSGQARGARNPSEGEALDQAPLLGPPN